MFLLLSLLALALGTDTFSLVLHGSCVEEPPQYSCSVTGESHQSLTLLGDTGVFFDAHKLNLGVNATMTFKGTNPTSNTFTESGSFFVGDSSFSFSGNGIFYRNANHVISGAGAYNATGISGAFENRTGVATALNHGSEEDNSFTVHLVVRWL